MIHKTEILSVMQRKTLGVSFMFGAAVFAFSQQKISVEGHIVGSNEQSVPYASVSFSHKVNKIHNDSVLTDENGKYKIDLFPGTYQITVESIDFKKYTVTKTITLAGNLGQIKILPEATVTGAKTKELEGIVITSTKKAYKVELDKKTYDPSEDILSKGGNLQDVLSNVPSVEVDTDGTVSMRGNSNVKFLINGKPSSLLGIDDGASALQSIPADQIERIEVITNPSSKFETSGTAGILNIILKKSKGKGFNGSVEGALGYFPSTRLNTNLSWRKGKWIWFMNGGGSYAERENTRWTHTKFMDAAGNVSKYLNQDSDNLKKSDSYNANAGFNVNLSEKVSFNLSGMIRHHIDHSRDNNQYDYLSAGEIRTHQAERLSIGTSKGTAVQGDAGFDYKFNTKGHNLFTSFSIQQNTGNDEVNIKEINKQVFDNRNLVHQTTKKTTTIGKADYELPIGEASKLEVGYRFDRNRNDYNYGVLKSLDDINFTPRPDFTSHTIYQETFNAVYAQFRSKVHRFGYQLGLRAEHTNVDVDFKNLNGTDSGIKKNYIGYFPSVFLSYDVNGSNNQLLLNYSRRINRPVAFFLIPFSSFKRNDDRNQFFGNLDLNPEYVNSIELGYVIQNRQLTINPTLYFRHTENETRTVPLRENENSDILITRPYNIGSDIHYGLDLNLTADVLSWWKIMANANLFRYESKGEFYNEKLMSKPRSFNRKGFSSRLRLTNNFKIDKTFNLQLQGSFRGGEKTESSIRKSTYSVNLGANKTIWNGNGTISFNIQDLFNTQAMNHTTFAPSFQRDLYMQFTPRQFVLSFTYRFKQGAKVEKIKPKKDINANVKGGNEMPVM